MISLPVPSALTETLRRVTNDPELWNRAHDELTALVEAVEKIKRISDSGDCGRMLEDALVPFDFGKQETITVYEIDGLLHLPLVNACVKRTLCLLDATEMKLVERPLDWAGVWCQACAIEASR